MGLKLIGVALQLIVFFSKSLLRAPEARSELSEMVGETHFQRYLPETGEGLIEPEKVRRHILCTGMSMECFGCSARETDNRDRPSVLPTRERARA